MSNTIKIQPVLILSNMNQQKNISILSLFFQKAAARRSAQDGEAMTSQMAALPPILCVLL
jgi:hypothetical protein